MEILVSAEQMYALEHAYFESSGLPSEKLMERAADEVVRVLCERLHGAQNKTVVFVCGPGNNGGDASAAARLFNARGGRAVLMPVCDMNLLKGDALLNMRRALSIEEIIKVQDRDVDRIPIPDAWVDGIFGIGLDREVKDSPHVCYTKLFARMQKDRERGSLVLSIDIPSGISARSGRKLGRCVQVDITVTFEYAKYGHLLNDGLDACGQVMVRPIGLAPAQQNSGYACRITDADIKSMVKTRRRNSYKGDYGHLLVVAGSLGMAGACILTASAALRSGAGLVSVACVQSLVPIVQACVPCAICIPLPERKGVITAEAVTILQNALQGKTALVIGPGLSQHAAPEVVAWALKSGVPVVLDADALNILSQNRELLSLLSARHVITPHPGEAQRLLNRSLTDPVHDAQALSELGAVALLKGATSVVAGNQTFFTDQGSASMATGGSGDVLTGIIGALLAQGMPPETAAYTGSALHGKAGELVADRRGEIGAIAADQIDMLPKVFSYLLGADGKMKE